MLNFHSKITSFSPQLFRSNLLFSFLRRLNSRTIHNGVIQKQFKHWTWLERIPFFSWEEITFCIKMEKISSKSALNEWVWILSHFNRLFYQLLGKFANFLFHSKIFTEQLYSVIENDFFGRINWVIWKRRRIQMHLHGNFQLEKRVFFSWRIFKLYSKKTDLQIIPRHWTNNIVYINWWFKIFKLNWHF